MVRHQHVGVYGAVVALRAFLQTVSIGETIFLGEKRGLPIVAALNHVVRHASNSYPCTAWHCSASFRFMSHDKINLAPFPIVRYSFVMRMMERSGIF
jgi:hypothetical protein